MVLFLLLLFMNIDELKKINFAFVIARGRSGTTLLRTMLNANLETIAPIESKLIVHLKQRFAHEENWTEIKIENFLDCLYQDVKFNSFWSVDRQDLKNNILSYPLNLLNFQLIIKIVFLSFPTEFEKHNIHLLVDKNPSYAVFLDDLNKLFPDAKYVHIVRDYRDNIQSAKKTNPIKNVTVLAHGWLQDNIKIEKFKNAHPSKVYMVRYEDLVNDPGAQLKPICAHLGIDFSEEMINYQNKLKSEIENKTVGKEEHKSTFKKYHGNLTKPVNTESINKWKKYLSDEEVSRIEYVCREYGKQYGYQPTQTNNRSYMLSSIVSKMRYDFNVFVLKSYYNWPFWFRNFLRSITRMLYAKFNYTTIYNRLDYSKTNEE